MVAGIDVYEKGLIPLPSTGEGAAVSALHKEISCPVGTALQALSWWFTMRNVSHRGWKWLQILWFSSCQGLGPVVPLPRPDIALTSRMQGRMLCWLLVPGLKRMEPSTFCPWDTCSWSPEWPCRWLPCWRDQGHGWPCSESAVCLAPFCFCLSASSCPQGRMPGFAYQRLGLSSTIPMAIAGTGKHVMPLESCLMDPTPLPPNHPYRKSPLTRSGCAFILSPGVSLCSLEHFNISCHYCQSGAQLCSSTMYLGGTQQAQLV